ncbi:phage tail assembly chaperone [Rhizobium leguminosarum]|uniref:phage tail assembly chaperone n=1 Tax=Rhizobium leguminosarum TaxID=384 RepID=UPI0028A98639|nr:phage tail assembly chaperone [Rhizobium leguminosarum]
MTELPWEDIMSSAMGILKWPPDMFWKATFYEFTAAMRGHFVSQGIDVTPPMTRDEFLTMKAEDEARESNKRMPDA